MASLNCNGLDGLMLSLKEIEEIPADVQYEILNAQADIVVEAQKAKGRTYGVERTGMTLDSIKKSRPKHTKNGRTVNVAPTGTNADGNTNSEVAFINNYGKRGQPARPFITDANESSAEATTQAALEVYNRWLQSKGL